MENAVSGYLDMKKAEWAAIDKCPKLGCNGKRVAIVAIIASSTHTAPVCVCSR